MKYVEIQKVFLSVGRALEIEIIQSGIYDVSNLYPKISLFERTSSVAAKKEASAAPGKVQSKLLDAHLVRRGVRELEIFTH